MINWKEVPNNLELTEGMLILLKDKVTGKLSVKIVPKNKYKVSKKYELISYSHYVNDDLLWNKDLYLSKYTEKESKSEWVSINTYIQVEHIKCNEIQKNIQICRKSNLFDTEDLIRQLSPLKLRKDVLLDLINHFNLKNNSDKIIFELIEYYHNPNIRIKEILERKNNGEFDDLELELLQVEIAKAIETFDKFPMFFKQCLYLYFKKFIWKDSIEYDLEFNNIPENVRLFFENLMNLCTTKD